MCAVVQLSGLYPRSESLIEKTRSYERGRSTEEDVQRQVERDTRELVQLQELYGFDTISDGSLSWQDQLRPLTKSLKGVQAGTRYSRWFDTNTFFQKPIVKGKIVLSDFHPKDFIQSNLLPKTKNWKVTLPGPYTFSQLVDNQYYASLSDLVRDVAVAENQLARKLHLQGVTLFQLIEPCLVYQPYRTDFANPQEIELGLAAVNKAAEGIEKNVSIQTYFGDASTIFSKLLNLNVNTIGFDVFQTDYSKLHLKTAKTLALGIVDSRDSNIEEPGWIAETALRISKHIESEDLILIPNSDLKFLPKPTADEKTKSLAKAATELGADN